MNSPKIAFELATVTLPLTSILPVRQVKDPERTVRRYTQIRASIKVSGLVEPLVVFPRKDSKNSFLLIDGHLRYYALQELKVSSALCIISTDDEGYTYNAKVNRLAPIQEHRMLVKAISNGVSPERLAAALGLKMEYIRSATNLLEGLHHEAVELLKDKMLSPKTLTVMKRVSGVRQVEIAELMISTNNFSAWYAEALLVSTPKEEFKNQEKPKTKVRIAPEEIARMEQEMACLKRDLKETQDSFGKNNLALTLVQGYARRLLKNAKVAKFLRLHHANLFAEFETMLANESPAPSGA